MALALGYIKYYKYYIYLIKLSEEVFRIQWNHITVDNPALGRGSEARTSVSFI